MGAVLEEDLTFLADVIYDSQFAQYKNQLTLILKNLYTLQVAYIESARLLNMLRLWGKNYQRISCCDSQLLDRVLFPQGKGIFCVLSCFLSITQASECKLTCS